MRLWSVVSSHDVTLYEALKKFFGGESARPAAANALEGSAFMASHFFSSLGSAGGGADGGGKLSTRLGVLPGRSDLKYAINS